MLKLDWSIQTKGVVFGEPQGGLFPRGASRTALGGGGDCSSQKPLGKVIRTSICLGLVAAVQGMHLHGGQGWGEAMTSLRPPPPHTHTSNVAK